jgi:hypothetical protein
LGIRIFFLEKHTTETPWRLEISSRQELLCCSYFDGSFESFWLSATWHSSQ